MSDDQRQLNAALRLDFTAFLHRVFLHMNPGQPFFTNWHLLAIAHELELARLQGGARSIICIPPRSLKSITISVAWVAWMLGRDPRLKFVCVSYAAELALKHARDCRGVMRADWYRQAFPDAMIARDTEHDVVTTAGGGRVSTSVGGVLTGRGGDIIIIDDPMKPDDASSEVMRARLIDWFGGTLMSRLDNKAKGSIIVVMQRLHDEDLVGHLLETDNWKLLNIPAIAEEDDRIPIGPGKFYRRGEGDLIDPRRETVADLEILKASLGSLTFSAQYQQQPLPAGGAYIKREWLRFYDGELGSKPGDQVVQVWDCAIKTGTRNDFSAGITALVRGTEVYILDVIRQRMEFQDLVREVRRNAVAHGAHALLVEDAASGSSLLQVLRDEGARAVPRPIALTPSGEKEYRVAAVTPLIEAGGLILPKDAPWLAEFIRELLGFPNTRHDDQIDALAHLLSWQRGRRERTGDVPPISYAYEFEDGANDGHENDNSGLGNYSYG